MLLESEYYGLQSLHRIEECMKTCACHIDTVKTTDSKKKRFKPNAQPKE